MVKHQLPDQTVAGYHLDPSPGAILNLPQTVTAPDEINCITAEVADAFGKHFFLLRRALWKTIDKTSFGFDYYSITNLIENGTVHELQDRATCRKRRKYRCTGSAVVEVNNAIFLKFKTRIGRRFPTVSADSPVRVL